MADPGVSIDPIARVLIAQCRSEIAAAWVHVEAARETLRRTRFVIARWQRQRDDIEARLRMPPMKPDDQYMVVSQAKPASRKPHQRRGSQRRSPHSHQQLSRGRSA